MREMFVNILGIWGMNGSVIALIKLAEVRDIVAILLGIVSMISTLLIIRINVRKLKKPSSEEKL